MKGLLLKDFYMIAGYCRPFMLVMVVFLAVSCFGNENFFFISYPAVIAGLIPVTLISYDEREKWNIYALTLPCSRGMLVSEKYLMGLLCELAVLAASAVAQIIRTIVSGGSLSEDNFFLLPVLFFVGLIGPALSLPFIFKFGAEKGRIAFYIIIGISCAIGAFFAGKQFEFTSSLSSLWLLALIAAASVMLYALSWGISILLCKRRSL